jgi:hypothetical protein
MRTRKYRKTVEQIIREEPKRYWVVNAVHKWDSLEVPLGNGAAIKLQQPSGSGCIGFLSVYENEEAARLENPTRKLWIVEEFK